MVLTAYNSVFGTTGVPDGFEFVVAIDWFLDRLCTVVNVTGDNIVACSVAHMVAMDTVNEYSDEEEEMPGSVEPSTTLHTQLYGPDHSSEGTDSEPINLPSFRTSEVEFSI